MASRHRIGRRSFLGQVGATTGLGALGVVAGAQPAHAYQRSDNDVGRYADPPGEPARDYGHTGITDSDGGAVSDPAGHGRGPDVRSGVTDSDGGANADPAGHGRGERGRSGFSDSDSGRCGDPAGYGRGGTRTTCPE
ncbi:twin-arginine translocation signal domain-containing protein [Parasphingopyxis marina]|uniref:Twin-arginine translocation signal domain-containing protein n=1 Tax=Parasphingopyxis marina TaxID=2761622 RepID=A0A842HVM8_9SPHN|nr:twin-arginine translocation signal domain-containing protein [Parasphingopyxis marina]MBC2776487.1 twin-arginine translocation signal domain-containing protein [Parasphingopyxis marina]